MGKVLEFKKPDKREDQETRIQTRLNSINRLMDELKEMNRKNEERMAEERRVHNKKVMDYCRIRRKAR